MERRLEASGPEIDIDSEMTYVTADIIFRTILSVNIEQERAKSIFDAFVIFQKLSPRAVLRRAFGFPRWWPFGRADEKKRLRAGQDIRHAIASVIRQRYDAVTATGNDTVSGDILHSLLQAHDHDTGERFSFDEIVDQVAMLFLAGHETSASALTWSLYLLATHPDEQETARKEVDAVFSAEGVSVSAVRHMSYVRDVFREALRLYPPVGFFARECAHSVQMRDKKMAKGATVIVAPWLIHRHELYWEKPACFDPSRFEKNNSTVPLRDIYLPFGMGPRVCIGTAFAMQEAGLILATILRQYRIEMAEGFEPQPVGRITVRSDNGMRIRLIPRKADGE